MNRFLWRVLMLVASVGGGLAFGQEEAPIVDDSDLRRQIQRGLEDLVREKKVPTVDSMLESFEPEEVLMDLREVSSDDLTPSDVRNRLVRSTFVFAIGYRCGRCTRIHGRSASAFAIGADGVVATNHHVLADGGLQALVLDAWGRTYAVTELLAFDSHNDLAVVRVEGDGFEPLPISRHRPDPGIPVYVLSHPARNHFVFTFGIVSRVVQRRVEQRPITVVNITAPYARGSSGAAVVDTRGNVVSVVKSTRSIYYEEHEDGRQENFQMVIRDTVPGAALYELLGRNR